MTFRAVDDYFTVYEETGFLPAPGRFVNMASR